MKFLWFIIASLLPAMIGDGVAAAPVETAPAQLARSQKAASQQPPGAGLVWQRLPGSAVDVAVGPDGSAFAVDPNGWVWRWNNVDSSWATFPGGTMSRIAVDPNGRPWAITRARQIFRYDGSRWQLLPGAARDIAVGADGSVFIAAAEGGLRTWDEKRRAWRKYELPGAAEGRVARLAVAPNGRPVVVTQPSAIFRFTGKTWEQLPGRARDVAVGPQGTLFVADEAGGLARWDARSKRWQSLGRPAAAVAAGPRDKPWVIGADGRLSASDPFKSKTTAAKRPSSIFRLPAVAWQRVRGKARDLGIGPDGTVFVADERGLVWRWNNALVDWSRFDGKDFARFAVDPHGNPWGVTGDGRVFRYENGLWRQMRGRARDIAAGSGGEVFVIGADGEPARWHEKSRNWLRMALSREHAGQGRRIAVDPDGRPLVVTAKHALLRFEGKSWNALDVQANDVAVGPGGTVYVVGPDGTPRRWDRRNQLWEEVSKKGVTIAVGPRDKPWLVEPDGQILAADLFKQEVKPETVAKAGAGPSPAQAKGFTPTEAIAASGPLRFTLVRNVLARDIGIGVDGSVFIVDFDGNVALYSNRRGRFESFPGATLNRIAVSPQGRPWGVNVDGEVFRHDGRDWELVRDITAADIAIGSDGTVIVSGPDQRLFRFNAASGRFELIDGSGDRVAVASNGEPWVVDAQNRIFRCNEIPCLLLPRRARDISIGPAGGVFIANTDNQLMRFNTRAENFEFVNQEASVVAAGPRDQPWVIDGQGRVFASAFFERDETRDLATKLRTQTGTTTRDVETFTFQKNLKFKTIGGVSTPFDIDAGPNGNVVAADQMDGLVYKFNSSTNVFDALSFTAPVSFFVRAVILPSGRIMVIGSDARVYEETSSSTFVERGGVPTDPGGITPDLGAGADGSVFYVSRGGELFKLGANNKFSKFNTGGLLFRRIDVDPQGRPWATGLNDAKVYQFNGSTFIQRPQTGAAQKARDVAVGDNGSVFIITDSPNNKLRKYNATNDTFDEVNITVTDVTVDRDGRPMVIDSSSGNIQFEENAVPVGNGKLVTQ